MCFYRINVMFPQLVYIMLILYLLGLLKASSTNNLIIIILQIKTVLCLHCLKHLKLTDNKNIKI